MGSDALIEFKDESIVVKHKEKQQTLKLNKMDKDIDVYVLTSIET